MEHDYHLQPVALSNLRVSNPQTNNSRIIVKKGQEHILLKTEAILFFYSDNKITYLLYLDKIKYTYDKHLYELQEILDPTIFFRANRKYIININFIRSYRVFEKVKLEVESTLPGITHRIIISQENTPVFKKWLSGL